MNDAKEKVKEVAGVATTRSRGGRSDEGSVFATIGDAISDAKGRVMEVVGDTGSTVKSTAKGAFESIKLKRVSDNGEDDSSKKKEEEDGNEEKEGGGGGGDGDGDEEERKSGRRAAGRGLGAIVPHTVKEFFSKNGDDDGGDDGGDSGGTAVLVAPVESFFTALANSVPGGGATVFAAVASMMAGLTYYLWRTYQEPYQSRHSKSQKPKVDPAGRFDSPQQVKEAAAPLILSQEKLGSVSSSSPILVAECKDGKDEGKGKKQTVITKHEHIKVQRNVDKK